jgi:aldose 1-epimerase
MGSLHSDPLHVPPLPSITRRFWGTTPARRAVWAYDLVNRAGTRLTAITLGATIVSLAFADREGMIDDVVLGVDDVDSHLERSPYMGTVAGRYANRIAGGRFTLDGVAHQLATNNPPNHLHGGVVGFDKRLYAARAVSIADGVGVRFSLVSADGEEGYPGEVRFSVRYLLRDDNRLQVEYRATTTRATPFNPSQHTYWNLRGAGSGDILGHVLQVHADHYTPVDATLIPTGLLAPVAGTPFDFRRPRAIGAEIRANDPQLAIGHGYDHNYVLRPSRVRGVLAHAARLHDPQSGRMLDVLTSEPGMQLYTGNFLEHGFVGRGGVHYGPRAGVCLETQHFPDSPNQPHFPSAILRPESPFRSWTEWRFGTDAAPGVADGLVSDGLVSDG